MLGVIGAGARRHQVARSGGQSEGMATRAPGAPRTRLATAVVFVAATAIGFVTPAGAQSDADRARPGADGGPALTLLSRAVGSRWRDDDAVGGESAVGLERRQRGCRTPGEPASTATA